MGRLTKEVFPPSCCDGGFASNQNSAQPCGCDPGCVQADGEGYKCERHRVSVSQNPTVDAACAEASTVSSPTKGTPASERHRVGSVNESTVETTPPNASVSEAQTVVLKGSPEWRKQRPLWSGVMQYFPDALLEVAHVSWVGNEQHNPGTKLHWDRSKSQDEQDACARHLAQAGTLDSDGTRHSAKAAWRALAMLQKELENEQT